MRASPLAVLVLALSTPALAEDDAKPQKWKVVCATQSKDGSRAVQGTDLVIEAGEQVKDGVAVEGDVIVRKGARVEDVVAIRGRVIVEPGGRVTGSAVSLGGEVRVHKGAAVDGDAIALGGRLKVDQDEAVKGDKVSLSFEIGGRDIVRGFIEGVLDEETGCHIVDEDTQDV
ncbi:hypothetical protein [Corallococcus macrosporus]|uniref:Polymer-forming cytoskeletal protein n=1 Tax=Corallococcus macrosporus DSM 14697 TaxID=1189310 RepID=A0A250JXR3_9BACT|nr:hypothetical protein [Corallococcus macrosporus]ATB48252.1 hypothetical protein MYMAC_003878 [Corallococcus macrosporus DSM 14697]